MAIVQPFRGLRPRPDLARQVASPPYDVLNSEEARKMAANNPYSFLRVGKPEIDLPAGTDLYSDAVYQKGLENFSRMIREGTLVRDESPCFYVYRLKMGGHTQTGLVVGAGVDEYEGGSIKKHELTRRDKEDDRARHVEVLQAQTGPVFCAYRARSDIRIMVEAVCGSGRPIHDFTAEDGIAHTLWVVSEPAAVAAVQETFRRVDAVYIADGHHRAAAACRVRQIMRQKNSSHRGDEPYNYFLAVYFPDDELRILAYHRVVKDLNGMSETEFMEKVKARFRVKGATGPQPDAPHRFGMYLQGRWHLLQAIEGTFPTGDPVRSLDVSILQENLLAPVLGIQDPRTDKRIDFVGGIRGTPELERRCREDARVAFSLYPVTLAQLMAIADAGQIMPPKSTWFEPKLRDAMVVRQIAE